MSASRRLERKKEVLIHKQYDLDLPLFKINNKKVAYENKTDKTHLYEVSSSDPIQMVVKNR